MENAVKVKGFFRLQIEDGPSGEIVGDSGWIENQVTNLGFKLYLADNIGASAGSKQIGYVALGTGAAPASNAVTLPGEISASTERTAVTYANVASSTAQFTATFASSDSFLGGASNLSNVGLYATTTTGDTLFAGNTYASSSCDTNQNVNVTYQIRFS
jgi:hypothetical protein